MAPEGEVAGQQRVERLAGVEERVVHPKLRADAAHVLAVAVDDLQVGLAQRPRVGVDLVGALQTDEAGVVLEGELELVAVHDVEHHHLVFAQPELLQRLAQGVEVGEEVGEDHHQPAGADLRHELEEHVADVCLVVGLGLAEKVYHLLEVVRPGARREHVPDRGVEGDHPHGVPLVLQEVGERGAGGGGVVELPPALAGVAHGLRAVDDQRRLEVGLLLVLFDVEPVGLRPHLPVDVLDLVAGRVLAVAGELDGEAVVRALVLSGDEPFDDQPGPDVQALDALEDLRVEVVGSFGCRHVMTRRAGSRLRPAR